MTNRDKLVTKFFVIYKETFGIDPKLSWIDFKSDKEIESMIKDIEENFI